MMEIDPFKLRIWSDDSLLVVNKPSGLPSLPDGWDRSAPHLKGVLEPIYGPLWIVHRLDRETSGVIVLARSAGAHRDLNTQFDQRRVSKLYHALVVGSPLWDEHTARMHLRADAGHKHRTVVDPRKGKPSVTHFRVLERFKCSVALDRARRREEKEAGSSPHLACSLIEAKPETGRTHQVRAHLAALGFPIACDVLYGGGKGNHLLQGDVGEIAYLRRVGLHARSLELAHPLTGERILFEAPYPDDFHGTLLRLRKYCS